MELKRIREKLRLLLDQKNMSMREVSLKAGLAHNAVANIMKLNRGRVNHQFLDKILQAMNVPFADFWEPDNRPAKPPPLVAPPGMTQLTEVTAPQVFVPVCGNISAGPFQLPDPGNAQLFLAGSTDDKNSFALTITGDSMAPDYVNGEQIFLRKTAVHFPALPNGITVGVPFDQVKHLNKKDCVVYMQHEGCTFKRVLIERGLGPEYTLRLSPVNPAHNETILRPEHDLWVQGICYKSQRAR